MKKSIFLFNFFFLFLFCVLSLLYSHTHSIQLLDFCIICGYTKHNFVFLHTYLLCREYSFFCLLQPYKVQCNIINFYSMFYPVCVCVCFKFIITLLSPLSTLFVNISVNTKYNAIQFRLEQSSVFSCSIHCVISFSTTTCAHTHIYLYKI